MKTEREGLSGLYNIWSRHYLPLREEYGGRHDSWFAISAKPITLKGLKPSNVGVVQVDAFIRSDCVDFSDRINYQCFNTEWQENDFKFDDYKDNLFSRLGGEAINFEVKIPKERFTKLRVIPIPRHKIPDGMIVLPRNKFSKYR